MMTRIGSNCQLKGLIQVMAPFTSAQVPVRRLARTCLGCCVTSPLSSRWCLARNERIRSRLNEARVNPSMTVIFVTPITRMKPRPRW
jgi:hypothetical protein